MLVEQIGGARAAWYDGSPVTTEQEALDVIGDTYGQGIDIVIFPAELLPDDFFWLRTGLAGAVLQKFQNYGLRVAIVGSISRYVDVSPSLRDFVYETNRRGQMLFLPDREALEARL